MRKEKSKSGKVKMRNKALFIGIVAIVLAVAAIGVNANNSTDVSNNVNVPDVPHKINYQGYITDAAGNPITGDRDMTFSIYDSSTGGTPLWSETQNSVHVENGLFNVILGSVNPIPSDVFPIDESRWLETEIEGLTLTHRKEIVGEGYTVRAEIADQLIGEKISTCDVTCDAGTAQPLRLTSYGPLVLTADSNNDDLGSRINFYINGEAAANMKMTILENGNVGIGVKDPDHHLEVRGGGGLLVETNNLDDSTGAMLEFNGVNRDGIVNIFAGTWDDPYITGGRPVIKLHPSTLGNNTVILMVDDYDFQKFKIRTQGIGTTEEKMWRTGGKDVLTITQDGNVGIGTTAPDAKLEVVGNILQDKYGDDPWAANHVIRKARGTSSNPQPVQEGDDLAWFSGYGYEGAQYTWATGILMEADGTPGQNDMPGRIVFQTTEDGTNQLKGRMVIKNDGSVGIGTMNPDAKLTIKAGADGKVLKGYNQAGEVIVEIGEGLDYSETFPTTHSEITPGMVMVIDPVNKGSLTISSQAYDRKVAGVVAGAKGLSSGVRLGPRAEDGGDHAVALAGRVYCNVDTQYGDIEPGDLLTTSPTPGHAMVVKDFSKAQGSILGKAMEELSGGGKGQILVLVTLQ